MNISYSWLKRYISLPDSMTPQEIADDLTSIGLEVGTIEEVESIRGGLRGIVTGRVLTCIPHPDSDHLHITTVDLGGDEPETIVCGAPNVDAGQYVIVATVGTTLYDGDKEFQIKKSKIRGVESRGMICAEDEIGIGTSHDGIIVLPDTPKPGTPAAAYYGLDSDWMIEVDLTPNRIDAASHYGVARDLAAFLACHAGGATLSRPSAEGFAIDRADGAVTVEVADTKLCPRYSGVTIRGVKVGESPKWLRDILTTVGQRPINNIVDITNYILLGLGQPLHAFDLAKVAGGKIVVKTCPEGTPFTTLDGVERKLDARDLMICNAEAPMCIAGVFGGLDSGVTESTTDVFIESAYFNPTSVRKTARRHALSTDASFRYERGTDASVTLDVAKIAALLIKELAGGEICGEPVDIYPEPVEPAVVKLDYGYAKRLIGKDIPHDTIDSIARSLEMDIIGRDEESVTLRIPTYRVDVTRPCDVVEDILRIYGYNNVEISDRLRGSLSYKSAVDSDRRLRTLVADRLTALGFNEILNNSLTSADYYTDLSGYPADHCVTLLNPLSRDLSVMRQTLLFGGLESLAHNINRTDKDLMMYEFGNVYARRPEAEITAENPLAPFREGARLAIWMTGAMRRANWLRPEAASTVFDLKSIVAGIFAVLGIGEREYTMTPSSNGLYAASLDIATRSGKSLGTLGILAKGIAKLAGVKQEVVYAELDWTAISALARKKSVSFSPLPKTLPVRRDLALLLDTAVTMAQVEATVRQAGGKLLRSIELFDVYQGDKLPEGKKSYAIALTLRDDEKTLVDKQIEAVMDKIVAALSKRLGAELR
ncbi:MAG: phenylalanine--tRNA ligase subunit beta [Candidatus Amulumruptor sp.]|nr:phenylalanine--tRNA ligase subunit beta [Candidatus Amulumruptor sp.]